MYQIAICLTITIYKDSSQSDVSQLEPYTQDEVDGTMLLPHYTHLVFSTTVADFRLYVILLCDLLVVVLVVIWRIREFAEKGACLLFFFSIVLFCFFFVLFSLSLPAILFFSFNVFTTYQCVCCVHAHVCSLHVFNYIIATALTLFQTPSKIYDSMT